ncbi:MAG: arsenate reductase ArsC [Actinomycetota bacterium]
MTTSTDPSFSVPAEIRPMIESATARLVDEFEGVFSTETIQRAAAESYRSFAGARSTSFIPLFVERFTRQRFRALARVEGKVTDGVPMVVFLCVHNAGRSQMAAGWLHHLAGDGAEVFSGGSNPGSQVNPGAIEAMAEVGIDISDQFPKPWTDDIVRAADAVVTMGCGDACPVFPGVRYLDWDLDDPAGRPAEEIRPIRDEIEHRVRGLMAELGIPEANAGGR